MNQQQFNEFVEDVFERAGEFPSVSRSSGMLQEIDMGFMDSFVDDDNEMTIHQMKNLLHELRHELNQIESAIDRVYIEQEDESDR